MYDAHGRRDVEAALAMLAPDVEWPNVADGTVLHGHDEVRAYWTAQFAAIDPSVTPTSIEVEGDTAVVGVHQVVRTLDGELLREGDVVHTYTFADGLVQRMVVSEVG